MGEWKPREWYDAAYKSDPNLSDHVGSTFAPLWDRIAREVPPRRHIVDVGCGTGPMLPRVIRSCASYAGYDWSDQAIAAAQAQYPIWSFAFGVGDMVSALPLIWRLRAPTVLAVEVLEHIPHDVEFIRACGPGVELIASLPSRDSESHVRHFASADEVLARYGHLLTEGATCVPFDQWFILRGVTK
jgi:2-polyprenyl-3-methyl-5-hydroxy-6-metoxy-1,4-benzoquinol methylase